MTPIRYGLIGAGAFGTFCIEHYRKSELIEVVAVADANVELARKTATHFKLDLVESAEAMLARGDVDLVHLATPPFTHADLALKAIAAGKHVLCEKPLATSVADARRMLDAARDANRLLVVNLIMRYDPLNRRVRQIVAEKLLGEPIAIALTNLAGDFKLLPEHWFWDARKSGGIFVEHGVHFFDLFAMWLGQAEVLSAVEGHRPGNDAIVDQVQCVARHSSGALATHYHGFHQPGAMDRQEIRLICERGDIRLFEWLATSLKIDAMVDDATVKRIVALLPGAAMTRADAPPPQGNDILARHKRFHVDGRYAIDADVGVTKLDLYGTVIRELLEDQARWIRDPSWQRQIDESNGLSSLTTAEAARSLASRGRDIERELKASPL